MKKEELNCFYFSLLIQKVLHMILPLNGLKDIREYSILKCKLFLLFTQVRNIKVKFKSEQKANNEDGVQQRALRTGQ